MAVVGCTLYSHFGRAVCNGYQDRYSRRINYVRVYSYDTDGATNVAQSGGNLVVGNKTFAVVNAAADSSPKIDAGDILITPDATEGVGVAVCHERRPV